MRASARLDRLCVGVLLVLGATACEPQSTRPEAAGCAFEEGGRVARIEGGSFDAVAVIADGEGAVAAWSDPDGLWLRRLDARGVGRGGAQRAGQPCEGGIDLVRAAEGALLLACVRRAKPAKGFDGAVDLLRIGDDLEVRDRRRVGSAGRDSRGVSLAVDGDAILVAWHDGTPGAHRALWTRVEGEGPPAPEALSRTGVAGGPPAVWMHDGRSVLAWAETWFSQEGYTVGEVRVRRGGSPPERIDTVIHEDPRAVLAVVEDALVVGFRDERPAGTRPALFLRDLDRPSLHGGEPVRVGRADAIGGPSLTACDGLLWSAAPHSYGRSESLVGIRPLDRRLEPLSLERQLYEYGVGFSRADVACVGGRALVLAAERTTTARPRASIRSISLTCTGRR